MEFIPEQLNTSSSHPLIQNSQEYMYDRQIISIHSEDRNILRYPQSNDFIIELPQDYCNVLSITLESWTFPANYDTFSVLQNNITLAFKMNNIYNPATHSTFNPSAGSTDQLLFIMYEALTYYETSNTVFYATIEQGFYNPSQITTELQNRLNETVTTYIMQYINKSMPSEASALIALLNENGGYDQFIVAYNEVSQKLWFGNKSSGFYLANDDASYSRLQYSGYRQCLDSKLPEDINWGLPFYLGFTRCPVDSKESVNGEYPRFYYGNYQNGDNGYWLLPDTLSTSNPYGYANTTVFYTTTTYKINLMGPSYFYLEIDGLNNIDETSPFSISASTVNTNETNGIVKSSFAKISIPTIPISQWFENVTSKAIKKYNPPLPRLRKLAIRVRYHNGSLVQFVTFN